MIMVIVFDVYLPKFTVFMVSFLCTSRIFNSIKPLNILPLPTGNYVYFCLSNLCIYWLCFQLTSATTAMMTKLRTSMTDETFLRQLFQIGVLMEFESLLSCYGDEMAMLEDMEVGVNDLSHVVFKIIQASRPDDVMPSVTGNRWEF